MGRQADRLLNELIRSISCSPLASIVTNPRLPDNPIVAANASFEALTGYEGHELVGQNCRILAGPRTERRQSDALARAVAEARAVVVELLNYRKDGTTFMNAVMIAPVFDREGQLSFFLGSQMAVERCVIPSERQARDKLKALTPKQRLVIRAMAKGFRNRQIAAELGLTEKTIKMHRSALMRRLGLTTAAEAIRLAVEAGD